MRLGISLGSIVMALAVQIQMQPAFAQERTPLTVTVSKSQYLPPAMYGQWSVSSRLVDTNAPDFFAPYIHEIWILERSGEAVVLTNPANGASAAVNVDSVEGDSAVFHREVPTQNGRILLMETHQLAVNGNHIKGANLNRIVDNRNSARPGRYYGRYVLEAERMSDSRTRFKPEEELNPEPDIEIQDIQQTN
jgi:hypothetical protein